MYSPKISKEYIPFLYRLASVKKVPMTKLVDQIVKEFLMKSGIIDEGKINHEQAK